jgi:copper chaperone
MMTDATFFAVQGMSCGHCKAAVESELNELPGVESSFADVEKGIVGVRYDESMVSTEQLEGAIEKAGYTVAG